MNPDFEQRLRSGLSQEANSLPGHDGSLDATMTAGRRRQATRRIGTGLAAVALFVGGGALYAQNQPSDPVEVVVADDGRATVTSADGDADRPTTTAPDDGSTAADDAGRDPVALAIDQQVVVVDYNGNSDIVWKATGGQKLVMAQAAGRNGVVIETAERILWLRTGTSEPTVLKTEDQNLFLHDVTRIDGQWSAIWSEAPIDWESEEFKGSSRLVAQNVQTGVETEIESYSWLGQGDDWRYYTDATPMFTNGPMAIVRSYNQGACHWIDPIAPGGVMSAIATPLPRPDDPAENCTNPIITNIIANSDSSSRWTLAYVTGDFFNRDVIINTTDENGDPVTFPVGDLHSLLDFSNGRLRWAERTSMADGSESLVIVEADVSMGPGGVREVWRIGVGNVGVEENSSDLGDPPNYVPEEVAPPLPPSLADAGPDSPPPGPPGELAMVDWKSFLRTVPELTLNPDLQVNADRYPQASDYYDVFDGRNGGYPIFDAVFYGDLDANGSHEAMIPLDSGGTSMGIGILVFRNGENGPELVGPKSFYDPAGQKVWPTMVDGQLQIDSAIGADWEPSCCLSGNLTMTWAMKNGEMVLVGSTETGIPEARGPAVERFYSFLASGRFEEAYAMLSPAQQAREPFQSWKAGFANTREIDVDITGEQDNALIFDLTAIDEIADGSMTRTLYRGSWQLAYSTDHHQWLLDAFDVELIGTEELLDQGIGEAEPETGPLGSTWEIGFGTWGPLEVGMSKGELATLGYVIVFGEEEASEGCSYANFPESDDLPWLMIVDDKLARIEFIDPADRGPKGLGRASTEAEILAAYPDAVVTPHPYGWGDDDNSHYVEIADPAGTPHSFIFETDGTNVTGFRTGDTNINRWIEGCA